MTTHKMNSKKQSLMRFWKMIQADHPIFYSLLLCSLIGNLLVVSVLLIIGIAIDQLLQRISVVGMMNISLSDIKDTLLMPVILLITFSLLSSFTSFIQERTMAT